MPWDQKILPDAFLASASAAASAANDGSKDAAFMTHIQSGIGTSWKRQLLRADVLVFEGAGTDLIPFTGRVFTVPAVIKDSISNADIDTGEWVHRIVNASDATKAISNLVTKTGGAGPGLLSDDLVSPNDVEWGTFTVTGPSIDSVFVTLNAPTSVTSSGFTLSVNVSGAFPSTARTLIQWNDNLLAGVWRESPRPLTTSGTFSHTFTGAPANTLITWRAYVFTEPDTIHAQSFAGTFNTLAGAPTAGLIDTLVDHMGTHPFVLNSPPVGPTWPISAAIIKGADLRGIAHPSWWPFDHRPDVGEYWAELIPWFVVWDIVGHQSNLNVRAASRDCQLWLLDDNGTWSRNSNAATPTGNAYERNMISPVVGSLDWRVEPDGSSSVRFNPDSPYVWHGYGTWGTCASPATARAFVGRVQVRKVLHDPQGPDQRALARYSIHVGADPYPLRQNPVQFGSASAYNPGIALSRNVELTNDWQWIYFTTFARPPSASVDTAYPYNFRQTIAQSAIAANPPPF